MNTDNTQSLAPGTVLRGSNTYTIVSVLGAGGFGITYLASTTFTQGNIRIKGFVAIKEHFISDHCERVAGSAQMTVAGTAKIHQLVENSRKDFLAEARRLHQLGADHDNIVCVNEVFEANGTAYYVMEYLDGQSLQQYIEANGPLGSEAIRSLMTPIVDAAAYLHRNRFTHLDIKPANIMLAEGADGGVRPVLIDFGLSKHYDEHGKATSTVNTCGASDGYAPVEQYQGIRTFSPAADVYALGATMLACATGRRPSASANWQPGEPAATIAALPVDDVLKAVMTRALAGAAHDRYPDGGALLAALGANGGTGTTYHIKKQPDGPTTQIIDTSAIKPKSKVGLIVGAAAALVIVIGVYLANFLSPSSEVQPGEVIADEMVAESLATTEPEVLSHEWWEARRTPKNLYLAVNRNGGQYYLSEEDYRTLNPGQQSALPKAGVVIIGGGQEFILALNNITSESMNWNTAMRRYGNYLPTKAQGEAWMAQNAAVKAAVTNFGGSWPGIYHSFWTQTESYPSCAWYICMPDSSIYYAYKASTVCKIRCIEPIGGRTGKTSTAITTGASVAQDAAVAQAHPEALSQAQSEGLPQAWWNARRTAKNFWRRMVERKVLEQNRI